MLACGSRGRQPGIQGGAVRTAHRYGGPDQRIRGGGVGHGVRQRGDGVWPGAGAARPAPECSSPTKQWGGAENPYSDDTIKKTEAYLKQLAAVRAARQGGLEPGTQRRRGR